MASICSKDFSSEFQIGKLSEDHQKYNKNTHTHTHTHTHTQNSHTYTNKVKNRVPAAEAMKKHICHINMFKHLKMYLSFVD